jgi:hypothetical protein
VKYFCGLFLILLSLKAFSHGGDSGPATLEQEFSKMAHLHLPINYSTSEGFYPGYEIGVLESGLVLENHPIVFGGTDKIVRSTCLEQTSANVIEVCPESSPFLLLENKKWDLGFGLESHIHLPLPGVGFGAGISYIKGKTYYSARHLTNKNEKRASLKFPLNPAEFKNWRDKDQLFYMSKATIVFNVFVGYEPFVHLGPQISRTGTFRISMTKIDDKTLIAEIGNLKSKDFSFEGYALIAAGEFNGGRAKANSVTYQFNMEDESTYPILAYFVAGRLDLVNQAIQEKTGSVVMKTDSINKGRSLMGSLGIPVLFNNGAYRGTYLSNGTVEEMEEGKLHHHDVYSRSKVKDHSTRGLLSDHLWENQTLTTTIIREADAPTESILSVVLNWSFSRDHIKLAQFQKKMRKAAKVTGISKLREINLPDSTRGYVKVDVSINLSAEHVLKILTKDQKAELEVLQTKNEYQALNKKLMMFMNVFFKENEEQWFLESKPKIQIRVEGENLKQSLIHL